MVEYYAVDHHTCLPTVEAFVSQIWNYFVAQSCRVPPCCFDMEVLQWVLLEWHVVMNDGRGGDDAKTTHSVGVGNMAVSFVTCL